MDTLQIEILRSLESAMLPVVLTALNTAQAEASVPHMRVTSFDGLRQSVTNERVVTTGVYERLETVIRERQDGSFGISGPRGVGKSTLIKFFVRTERVRLAEEEMAEVSTTRSRPRLGVVVSAPVAYDPREFVLHLYAEICRNIIDRDPLVRRRTEPVASPVGRSRAGFGGLVALAAGALPAGFILLWLAVAHRLPWTWHGSADTGAAMLVAAVAALVTVRALIYSVVVPRFRDVRVRSRDIALIANVAALAAAGLTLLLSGGGARGDSLPVWRC